MKKLVREINNLFINLLLFFFYFVFIGLVALPKKLFNLKTKKEGQTYWQKGHNYKKKDYESAY